MSDAAEEKIEELENGAEPVEGNGEQAEEKEKEKAPVHLHTRSIPTIVMLAGGAAAAIFTFVRHDPVLTSLEIIFVSLIIFLVLGDVIKIILDTITIEEKDQKDNDDKVIERSKGEGVTDNPEEGEMESVNTGETTEEVES